MQAAHLLAAATRESFRPRLIQRFQIGLPGAAQLPITPIRSSTFPQPLQVKSFNFAGVAQPMTLQAAPDGESIPLALPAPFAARTQRLFSRRFPIKRSRN